MAQAGCLRTKRVAVASGDTRVPGAGVTKSEDVTDLLEMVGVEAVVGGLKNQLAGGENRMDARLELAVITLHLGHRWGRGYLALLPKIPAIAAV